MYIYGVVVTHGITRRLTRRAMQIHGERAYVELYSMVFSRPVEMQLYIFAIVIQIHQLYHYRNIAPVSINKLSKICQFFVNFVFTHIHTQYS